MNIMDKSDHPKPTVMSGRKFIGIWAVGGFAIGMLLATPQPDGPQYMLAERIGFGIPYAALSALLGAAVNYFFRSGKK